jgi:hypothetical protein
MANKLYIIAVRWRSNEDIETLQNQISTMGNWLRFSNHLWMLKTAEYIDSKRIYQAIDRDEAGIDQVLILEMNRNSRWGWSLQWIWQWIDSD